MTCSGNGTAELVTGVAYSLGSAWVEVATAAASYGFKDDSQGGKRLTTRQITPAAAPIGR